MNILFLKKMHVYPNFLFGIPVVLAEICFFPIVINHEKILRYKYTPSLIVSEQSLQLITVLFVDGYFLFFISLDFAFKLKTINRT